VEGPLLEVQSSREVRDLGSSTVPVFWGPLGAGLKLSGTDASAAELLTRAGAGQVQPAPQGGVLAIQTRMEMLQTRMEMLQTASPLLLEYDSSMTYKIGLSCSV
jgi:hypothetical protein